MDRLTRKITGASKQEREKHHTLPWIVSPFKGVNLEKIIFHQRHEANTIELFFDLFFVANLATFTAYHAIIDRQTLLSYIGFFTILWTTWFQITLFDVRFAIDSGYERLMKIIQFLIFITFAYVGAKYDPSKNYGDPVFYRTVCVTLAVSRLQLAVQYGIVLFYGTMKRASQVVLPLGLIVATFMGVSIVLASVVAAFNAQPENSYRLTNIFYGCIGFETIAVLGVSMYWRALSFKKTHIVERMGLLTLIVIGEGAIGVTKTVGKVMGKTGLQVEGSGLVFCIILTLVFLWVLYFDNQPEHHYGTIRQQIFCIFHFPLHLSIVGIVEGSQQLVLARYALSILNDVGYKVIKACAVENLEGKDLLNALDEAWGKYELEGYKNWKYVEKFLKLVKKNPEVCSESYLSVPKHVFTAGLPKPVFGALYEFFGTVFESMGIKLPKGKDITSLAVSSYYTVFDYYFAALFICMVCFVVFLGLTRRHKHDVFDLASIASRMFFGLIFLIIMIVGHNNVNGFTDNFLSSVMIIPTAVISLTIIIGTDRVGRELANWRLKRKGAYRESSLESFGRSDTEFSVAKHGIVEETRM